MNDNTAKRVQDAFLLNGIAPEPGTIPIDERITWLLDENLIETVPLGAPTEGGGVLITITRLRFELDRAHRHGGIEALEEVKAKILGPRKDN